MLSATTASAQNAAPISPHVAASLIAETWNVVAGQPLHVALRQQIQSGWHTYWSNPGEFGLPTTIDWTLPRDFRAQPISWPLPERFTAGPVVGYGYKHDVVLPVTIDVPADLREGTDVTLSAHVSWLACADICVPEEANLSLSLPVGTALAPDAEWVAAFATARADIPTSNPFTTTATAAADEFTLRIATGDATRLRNVHFFPADADVIDDEAAQSVVANSEELVVKLRRDKTKPPPATLDGVLSFTDQAAQGGDVSSAISISAPIAAAASTGYALLAFLTAVVLAFVGGIILNLMPCVLPVLSIKVLALARHSHSTSREMRLQGLAYAAGVLASFGVIGGALIALRAAGAEIGWGFQLQSPMFVALMIYLLFAVGLSLSGVFEIGGKLNAVGGDLASRDGYTGSFFTGALATLVATPCTGPFMAASIGYAVTQPWYVSLAVLEAVGAGLAFPYVVIAFSPRARGALPKPGMWMVRLKEILAFPVYATAVWLMYVLSQQVDASGTTIALVGLVLIAFSAWLYNAVYLSDGHWRCWGIGLSTSGRGRSARSAGPNWRRSRHADCRQRKRRMATIQPIEIGGASRRRPTRVRRLHGGVVHYVQSERADRARRYHGSQGVRGPPGRGAQSRLDSTECRHYSNPRSEWPRGRSVVSILSETGSEGRTQVADRSAAASYGGVDSRRGPAGVNFEERL